MEKNILLNSFSPNFCNYSRMTKFKFDSLSFSTLGKFHLSWASKLSLRLPSQPSLNSPPTQTGGWKFLPLTFCSTSSRNLALSLWTIRWSNLWWTSSETLQILWEKKGSSFCKEYKSSLELLGLKKRWCPKLWRSRRPAVIFKDRHFWMPWRLWSPTWVPNIWQKMSHRWWLKTLPMTRWTTSESQCVKSSRSCSPTAPDRNS